MKISRNVKSSLQLSSHEKYYFLALLAFLAVIMGAMRYFWFTTVEYVFKKESSSTLIRDETKILHINIITSSFSYGTFIQIIDLTKLYSSIFWENKFLISHLGTIRVYMYVELGNNTYNRMFYIAHWVKCIQQMYIFITCVRQCFCSLQSQSCTLIIETFYFIYKLYKWLNVFLS